MPRKSLAQQLYEDEENQPTDEGQWLLLYDFRDTHPHLNYWTNLRRLMGFEGESRLIQYSALHTSSRRIARAAEKLARYYGADTELFACTEAH